MMVLLIQLIEGDYWSVESLGTDPNAYTAGPNQKIIETDTWVSGKTKHEVEWDDKDKQVILYPEHLKVSTYKAQKLKEIKAELMSNARILDQQIVRNIVDDIKAANTTSEIDVAVNKIETEKQKALLAYGL